MSWSLPTHDSVSAKFARFRSPGYSWCLRCGMPWTKVEGHITNYGSDGRGCFPLCEGCWTSLETPDARIEYYLTLIDEWNRLHSVEDGVRENIELAVAFEA